MPTYTVHEPLPRKGEAATSPERFVFVRDGFHFWAFALSPLWLLLRRLWLALTIYIVFSALLGAGFFLLGVPSAVQFLAALMIAFLIGFEAGTIWRWTLTRRGWKTLGFVVGEDAEIAEQRFYAEWAKRAAPQLPTAVAEPKFATPVRRGAPSPSDVVGLFPEPRA